MMKEISHKLLKVLHQMVIIIFIMNNQCEIYISVLALNITSNHHFGNKVQIIDRNII
jgi:hypothetical protein